MTYGELASLDAPFHRFLGTRRGLFQVNCFRVAGCHILFTHTLTCPLHTFGCVFLRDWVVCRETKWQTIFCRVSNKSTHIHTSISPFLPQFKGPCAWNRGRGGFAMPNLARGVASAGGYSLGKRCPWARRCRDFGFDAQLGPPASPS